VPPTSRLASVYVHVLFMSHPFVGEATARRVNAA
jgi:hypothetical protein